MTLQIFNCDQRSPEWYACRAGIPTASEFHTLLAKGRDGGASKTRRTYMLKLAGERLTGEPAESYESPAMVRGREMEAEAREFYCFTREADLTSVGFIRSGQKGCSPDALIGDKGILEIKTAAPHVLIELLEKDGFPPEHRAQCQGALWVTGREWIDLIVYWPKLPPLVKRGWRDEAYIRDLEKAVDDFNGELEATVERIKRYGNPAPLRENLEQSILMAG